MKVEKVERDQIECDLNTFLARVEVNDDFIDFLDRCVTSEREKTKAIADLISEYAQSKAVENGGNVVVGVNNAIQFRRDCFAQAVTYIAQICYDEDYARKELEYHKVESYTDEEQRDAEAHGEYDDIRSTDLDKPKKKGKKQ